MPAQAISESQIERLAAEGAAQLRKERAASAPSAVGGRLAASLHEDDVLEWGGKQYRVPPVPHAEGAELMEIQSRIGQMASGAEEVSMQEYRTLLSRAVQIFPRLIRRRLAWLRPNPFRRASSQQIGALLGFFFACQLKAPNGARFPQGSGATRHRST